MDYQSEFCGADTITELHYHSDLNITTGICSSCKEHCNFHKQGDDHESSIV